MHSGHELVLGLKGDRDNTGGGLLKVFNLEPGLISVSSVKNVNASGGSGIIACCQDVILQVLLLPNCFHVLTSP